MPELNLLQTTFNPQKELKPATIDYFKTQLGFDFANLKTSDQPISIQIRDEKYNLQIVFQLTDEELGSKNSPREGWQAKPDGVFLDTLTANPQNSTNFDPLEKTPKIKDFDPLEGVMYSKYLVCSYDFGVLEKIPNKSFLATFNRQLSAKFDSHSGMPNLIVFRYTVNNKTYITFSVSELREKPNQRTGKYIASKVILLKDVDVEKTHRGHLEILKRLKNNYRNFDELYKNWLEVLSVETLSEDFYNKIEAIFKANLKLVDIPSSQEAKQDFLLKFFGRLVFCWFLRAKGWVDSDILSYQFLQNNFLNSNKSESVVNYYHQILEPLFFALLNKNGPTTKPSNNSLSPEIWSKLSQTPYLNGGLFQHSETDFYGKDTIQKIPNKTIQELFELFEDYYFTIDENTPDNQEIGVDPEMMGSIFEGLVATRSGTGSFYTRKNVVEYMVDKTIATSLQQKFKITNLELQDFIDLTSKDTWELLGFVESYPKQKIFIPNSLFGLNLAISGYTLAKIRGFRFDNKRQNFDRVKHRHPEITPQIWQALLDPTGQNYFILEGVFVAKPKSALEISLPKIGLVLSLDKKLFVAVFSISFGGYLILDTIHGSDEKKIEKLLEDSKTNLSNFSKQLNNNSVYNKFCEFFEGFLEILAQKNDSIESSLNYNYKPRRGTGIPLMATESRQLPDKFSNFYEAYSKTIKNKNTLVKLGGGNLSSKTIQNILISSQEKDLGKVKNKVINHLKNLKTLDPACGSGAFPVGILQHIVELRQFLEGEKANLYQIKNEILKNCIYGVDLMPIAVEITKLRCWLYLIVDQKNQGLDPETGRYKAEPLPNIDMHFCQGDSLVSQIAFANLPNNNIKNRLLELKNQYYSEHSNQKLNLKKEIQSTIDVEYHKYLDKKIENIQSQINNLNNQKNSDSLFLNKSENNKEQAKLKAKNQKQIQIYEAEIEAIKKQKNLQGFHYQLNLCELFENKNNKTVSKIDIIIGNPPYVSTKETGDKYKPQLQSTFGFADDLYSHFFFKVLTDHQDFGVPVPALLRHGGLLCFITSKTYFTIQTKHNLRQLILSKKIIEINDVGNPFFKSAMVDTAICLLKNINTSKQNFNNDFGNSEDMDYLEYDLVYQNSQSKTKKHILDFENQQQTYTISNQIYTKAINQVIFEPNPTNLKIYNKYNQKVAELMNNWWGKINTSKNITKHQTELEKYRNELQPGDITLLGLVTDGGVGLQTGENGKYVGVLDGTKEADRVRETRPEKLFKAKVEELNLDTKKQAVEFLNNKTEYQIREVFDNLKEKYGRDIFGQGYLFRIVQAEEVADLQNLTEEEKQNGIKNTKSFVPYDKGDKDGNRWYLKTPYYIDWSYENVQWMKKNSGKKGSGMPVVRNPQFYFREGFCWNNVLQPQLDESKFIKCRLKDVSIHDVASMTMVSLMNNISTKFLVCFLNSSFAYSYLKTMINQSVNLQLNDFRQFPIIIPTAEQLADFENLFDRAYNIKTNQFDGSLPEDLAKTKLDQIQKELDDMVEGLYGLK